jgi:4-amino-4-deoxy-L-arabinose transferase-like glycosyltransferase
MCLALYLVTGLTLPLSRGEAMYALVPAEMLAAGRFFLTTLNGVPYLEKPPLLYWLNLLAFKVLGVSDWAARVPTSLITAAEVWLVFRLGLLLLNPRAAWLGGFVLLSSVGFFYLHLELFTDHLITLALLAALYCLVRWLRKPRLAWALSFHLALVAGYLSKGLIGLGFPLVIGALYGLMRRQARVWRLVLHPGGLALLAALLVPWFAATEAAHPGFLWHHFVDEHLIRLLGERQPGGVSMISLPLFWLFLAVWLMPWAVLLPEALYRYGKEVLGARAGGGVGEGSLLMLWPVVVLVVFSLSSSRIEYYSLPALPPLALILGWRLDRYLASPRDSGLAVALLVLGIACLGAVLFVPFLEKLCAGNRREFVGLFALVAPIAKRVSILVPPLALLGALRGRGRPRVALAAYAAVALALVFFTFQALTALAPVRSDKAQGEYVFFHARPGDVAVMESIEEFELGACFAFYARRPILMVQRRGLPRFVYPVPPEQSYLIFPTRLRELWQGPGRVFLLADDVQPLEPWLAEARVVLAQGGKRLLVNGP